MEINNNTTKHDVHGDDHDDDHGGIPVPFLYPFFCLATGLIFDALFSRSMATVFLLGMSFGLTMMAIFCLGHDMVEEFLRVNTWAELDPHYTMFALLPTLIFESALNLDAHHFKHFAGQLLTFAIPAFILAFVTMGQMMFLFMYAVKQVEKGWTMSYCLLYGAVVSATDPVAVVALLKALGVPHHLKVLIEGESLFNDGAAIFFHGLIHTVLKSNLNLLHGTTLWAEIAFRFMGVCGSVLIGYFFARTTAFLLGNMFDSVRERAVVLIFVYASYVTAELIKGSGVLALVIYGIALNSQRQWMSTEAYVDNKRMWGFLAYCANCIIFITTGLLAARDMRDDDVYYIIYGLAAYAFSVISRAVAVSIFAVVLVRRFGPYPAEFSPILIWGGLRGSLALLLALASNGDPVIEKLSPGDKKDDLYKTTLGLISITVVLSNLIQGVTCGPLTQKLGLCGMSMFQIDHMKAMTKRLNEHIKSLIETKKKDPFYAQTNWRFVDKKTKLSVHLDREESQHKDTDEEDPEEEARESVQRCYDAQLWKLWNSGFLSVDVRALQNAINEAASTHGALNVDHLYERLKSSKIRRSCGLFCLKWGGIVDAQHCKWFADKAQTSDAWLMLTGMIACVQGGFAIYLFVAAAEPVSPVMFFANCLLVLFLGIEPLLRLWSDRNRLRKIYTRKCVIWPWIDLLSVAVYFALFAVYVVAFHYCRRGTKADRVYLYGKTGARAWCNNLRAVILFGAVSLLKLPQVLFLIFRFLIHVEIAGALQLKDEEALEGLNALIAMTQTVKDRLDDGTLIRDPDLQKKLSAECQRVKTDAEKKVAVVMRKEGGQPMMATIKTRQVCREMLSDALRLLKKLEEDGDLGEAEIERLTEAVDVRQRKVRGLHKLTRKPVHESDKSGSSAEKEKPSTKKKVAPAKKGVIKKK